MPGGKAVKYAEDTLAVHRVYAEAEVAAMEANNFRQELHRARTRKAAWEDKLVDREMELAADERGANPEMSQAAFERHMKNILHFDPEATQYRQELAGVNQEISNTEVELARVKTTIEIRVGRLYELGGYFGYLAALKEAETAGKDPANWPPATS